MPEPIPAVDSSGMALARPVIHAPVVVGPAAGGRCHVIIGAQRWFNIDDAPETVVNAVLGYRVRRRHRTLDLAHHRESAHALGPAPIPVEAGLPAITAR